MIHTRRYAWLLPVLAVALVAGLAFFWLSDIPRDFDVAQGQDTGMLREGATGELEAERGVVGSTGRNTSLAAPTSGGAPAVAVVRELETITGVLDGHELIGRRVELRVPVQSAGGGVTTFWVGSGDNRLLVVLDPPHGAVARHGIEPANGQVASVTGTIQQVPEPEERYSWRLTREEEEELLRRNVYIRAERVMADGHGE